MKISFIKYQKNKEDMLKNSISKAVATLEKGQTIHLVWGDRNSIRGQFYHDKYPYLNRPTIEKLMKSEKIAVHKGFITSTSLDSMSDIKDGDIVIDCFTGQLYSSRFTNLSWLIHLPWLPHESELLASRYESLVA